MNKKKALFLNLPHKSAITRRYMCSYESPTSLLPPYELISAAAILKNKNVDVQLIDCIAEGVNINELINRIKSINFMFIITLIGFESFEEDISNVKILKSNFPNTHFSLIGHYPTLFSKQTLNFSDADSIILGEPDKYVENLLIDNLNNEIEGIYTQANSNSNFNRIKSINELPLPLHYLANNLSYGEPFLPKPFGMIQSSRGCPYSCNFCVTSYGKKLTEKTPEYIIEELESLMLTNKIKSFRFIDDTFTVNKKRVLAICNLIIEKGYYYLRWTCLSRLDTIDEEMALKMKEAGCVRIYFGIESGSVRILEYLNKKIDLDKSLKILVSVRKIGIQTAGFFLLGLPGETMNDIDLSIDFAKKSKLMFIATGKFTPYPGTSYYDVYKENINFSLSPYNLEFKEKDDKIEFKQRF